MIGTIALGAVAGFFVGNGIPYFVTGSFGWRHRFLLGESAVANVVAGVAAIGIGALCWHFADAPAHPWAAGVAALVGALAVGLIHAKVWTPRAVHHAAERT